MTLICETEIVFRHPPVNERVIFLWPEVVDTQEFQYIFNTVWILKCLFES
jgi:hypothetical protein